MSRYCGDRQPPPYGMESEWDFFHIAFHSNAIFDATGFFAYYQFISRELRFLRNVCKLKNTTRFILSSRASFTIDFLLENGKH
uniref:CUB domain-containing protein n=1 Tax=Romanomermis culicivorax TaxID=13658 RepID=A0A915LE52_ROMCU